MDIYETFLEVLSLQDQKRKAGKCLNEQAFKDAASALIQRLEHLDEVSAFLREEQYLLALDTYKMENLWG